MVYQESIEFAHRIYQVSKQFPKDELFGISSQLRRPAISIPANIAEGSSRGKNEFAHFLNISRGSCYECIPLLEVAKYQDYINRDLFTELVERVHKIAATLSALKN